MRVTHVGIFLHLAYLCLASASRLTWTWASKEPSEQRLLRLYPTSLEECLDACLNNDGCQSVIYERLANLCDIHDILEPLNEHSSRGSIAVHRNDIVKSRLGLPRAEEPVHTNTKACSLSGVVGYRLFGNMNRVGDRLVVDNGTKVCSWTTFSCEDDGKWVETGCKEQPRDCDDYRPTLPSGNYIIFPYNESAVEVFCDFNDIDGPWTVIQRRVDGTTDFYRPFQSYVEGFGNLTGNFWLGLDAISAITLLNGRQYKLKVIINDSIVGKRFAEYSLFKVMNASLGYELHVGGYSGDAGDSLARQNGQKFSTYDMDRDSASHLNCAEMFTGAWWYQGCHHSNLNGKYGDDTYGKGLNWLTTTTHYRSALFATMKLKPVI